MPLVVCGSGWFCLVLWGIAFRLADTFSLIYFSPRHYSFRSSNSPTIIHNREDSKCDSGSSSSRQQHPCSYRQCPPILPWAGRHQHIKIALPAVQSAAVDPTSTAKGDALSIDIKPATFQDLRAVSRLLVEEFYGNTLWFQAQRLVELARLQNNFHSYEEDASLHLMLIATSVEDGSLVGFVDIDGRERKTEQQQCELNMHHEHER